MAEFNLARMADERSEKVKKQGTLFPWIKPKLMELWLWSLDSVKDTEMKARISHTQESWCAVIHRRVEVSVRLSLR